MNMSRLILMPRLSCLNNAAHLKPIKFEAVVTMAPQLTVPCRGLKVPAKKAAGGKGKKGAAMVKPDLDVETDAHKVHYWPIEMQRCSTILIHRDLVAAGEHGVRPQLPRGRGPGGRQAEARLRVS